MTTDETPRDPLRVRALRKALSAYDDSGDGAGMVQTQPVRDLVQAVHQFVSDGCCGPHYIDGFRAALATPDASLDVEALALAMHRSFHGGETDCASPSKHRSWAERFATEYTAILASRHHE